MSERRPALAPRLRQNDSEVEERGMPSLAHARVAAHLRAEAERRKALGGLRFRWLPAFTFAAGAALVLLVVHLGLRGQNAELSRSAQAELRVLGGFTVEGEGCTAQVDGSHTVVTGKSCRLVAPQLAVHTWGRTAFGDDDGLQVHNGSALFSVEAVEPGTEPVRIAVSHGTIEVLGTRFTIEQWKDGGFVDLFEGRIRFVPLEGDAVEVLPGQRHAWGRAPEVVMASEAIRAVSDADELHDSSAAEPSEVEPEFEPEVESASSRSRRARPRSREAGGQVEQEVSPMTATEIIEIVAQHRAAGRYADAVSVLREADRSTRWDRRTAQVLSYELGEIMGRHMHDVAAACAHWERHQERFGAGRYASAVEAAHKRLRCAQR